MVIGLIIVEEREKDDKDVARQQDLRMLDELIQKFQELDQEATINEETNAAPDEDDGVATGASVGDVAIGSCSSASGSGGDITISVGSGDQLGGSFTVLAGDSSANDASMAASSSVTTSGGELILQSGDGNTSGRAVAIEGGDGATDLGGSISISSGMGAGTLGACQLIDMLDADEQPIKHHSRKGVKAGMRAGIHAVRAWGYYSRLRDSFVHDNLYGLNKCTFTCTLCQHRIIRFEDNNIYPIPVVGKNMQDRLAEFSKTEIQNDIKCTRCNKDTA